MESMIAFEDFIYGDGKYIKTNDIDFGVDRIILLPKFRPHRLEKAVSLSVEYCQLPDFRRKLLEKSNECPVLIHRLYKRGVFAFEEIKPFLRNKDTFILSYYFRKEFEDFETFIQNKYKPHSFDQSLIDNSDDIDQQIEYGFLPSSIEYCIKYDVIDNLVLLGTFEQKAKWSLFEWSYEPEYLDLLSFSGFFGSIRCFKHLLINGLEINENVVSMAVCSGCFDLFYLCKGHQFLTHESFCKATQFFHLPWLVFMIENGSNINAKDKNVDFLYINVLLCI